MVQCLLSISVNHRLEKIAQHCAVDAFLPDLQKQTKISLGAAGRSSGKLQSRLRAWHGLEEAYA